MKIFRTYNVKYASNKNEIALKSYVRKSLVCKRHACTLHALVIEKAL